MRAVVEDQWNNMAPSWSRDGQWIYFASDRDRVGEGEDVWKVFPGWRPIGARDARRGIFGIRIDERADSVLCEDAL